MPPPEPNKKIEELLTAYSRKRREQAEPGFELHPVSRKALLQEVNRTFAQPDAKAPARGRLADWWRWFAVGGVMVWVLILCFYIQVPTMKPVEQTFEKAPPIAVLRSVSGEADKKVEGAKSLPLSDAGTRSMVPAATAPVTSPQPTDGSLAASAVAKPAAELPYQTYQNGLGIQNSAKPQDQKTAPVASDTLNLDTLKSPPAGAAGAVAVQSAARGGQQFVQFNNRAQYRVNVLSPPVPKVLTAFELERMGNNVRITDADGSIYEGKVLTAERERFSDSEKDRFAGVPQTNAAGNYSFEVSGMNRNLKQKVVFTGDVNETAMNTQNIAGKSFHAVNQQNAPNQQSQRNFSCEGRVQVGKSSEFQLQAMPVP